MQQLLAVLLAAISLATGARALAADGARLQADDRSQTDAVRQLAQRLLGADASRFSLSVKADALLPRHRATLVNTGNNSVGISANSGVAAAWALHYYLTQHCSCMVTWAGSQLQLPAGRLPLLPGGQLQLLAQDKYTVMPNVCTFSYTYNWWNFTRWERHIDWMALHGVNLAYALDGQEFVFANVFRRLGVSDSDLQEYFAGPAFLTWSRMGNLKKWGGPLPSTWISQQVSLQRQILGRMLALGMAPVLQGFSGIVPDSFARLFPHVNYTRLGSWANFNSTYTATLVLDPAEPLFVNISQQIVKESISVFGDVTDYYAMDTFNENRPERSDEEYLGNVSAAIIRGLQLAKPGGVWLLQNWFFGNDAGFWTLDRVKAFLQPVPKGQLLILDMYGDSFGSLAPRLNGYFGHQFMWTLLQDFGGNNAMFGGLSSINSVGPWPLRRQFPDTMVGVGITPEGLLQNEAVYEFTMEFNWRREPVSEAFWVREFARRRYASDAASLTGAWSQLQLSLYNNPGSGEAIPAIIRRPALTISEYVYYDTRTVEAAWRQLLSVNGSGNQLLLYDQIDLTRQMLQIRFYQYYQQMVKAANNKDTNGVTSAGAVMLKLLTSMDWLLQTHELFLLQRQIEDAKAFGSSKAERQLYEFNVRNQLTCWGPGPYNIQDYAGRLYNGLISQYYLPRWQYFLVCLVEALGSQTTFVQAKFDKFVFRFVEHPFYMTTNVTGPATPTGNAYQAAKAVEAGLPPAPTGDFEFNPGMRSPYGDVRGPLKRSRWL